MWRADFGEAELCGWCGEIGGGAAEELDVFAEGALEGKDADCDF